MIRPLVLALACALIVACSKSEPKLDLKEVQRAKSGDMTVVLLAKNDALKPGKDQGVLEFRTGTDQHLVDVGTVKMTATMPMAGMAPMMGSTFINRSDTPGRYTLESDLGMAGTWQMTIEWNGPAGSGKISLPGTVR